jgi:hypothetical protein
MQHDSSDQQDLRPKTEQRSTIACRITLWERGFPELMPEKDE